jgi:hypothetical protein
MELLNAWVTQRVFHHPHSRASICLIRCSMALRTSAFEGTSNSDDAMI